MNGLGGISGLRLPGSNSFLTCMSRSPVLFQAALLEKSANVFSVQPLCSLCLCGYFYQETANHRDTENTEVAQRKPD